MLDRFLLTEGIKDLEESKNWLKSTGKVGFSQLLLLSLLEETSQETDNFKQLFEINLDKFGR